MNPSNRKQTRDYLPSSITGTSIDPVFQSDLTTTSSFTLLNNQTTNLFAITLQSDAGDQTAFLTKERVNIFIDSPNDPTNNLFPNRLNAKITDFKLYGPIRSQYDYDPVTNSLIPIPPSKKSVIFAFHNMSGSPRTIYVSRQTLFILNRGTSATVS